jgi:hypothetical protein
MTTETIGKTGAFPRTSTYPRRERRWRHWLTVSQELTTVCGFVLAVYLAFIC